MPRWSGSSERWSHLPQGLLEVLFRRERRFPPAQQHEQCADVVGHGCDALGDRVLAIETQGVETDLSQLRQDLDSVHFPVAVGVFP